MVFITVDQLIPAYFDRWGSQFTGGLARLARNGAHFTEGYQDHAVTETAPGHASTMSGRHPRSTGIVANDRGVYDEQAPVIGGGGSGASPYRFRGSVLYDWMRASDPAARSLSVSRKDRGAILPLGRAGRDVYWYTTTGRMSTSTWYGDTLPSWVQAFNARRIPHSYAGREWTLLLPDTAYAEPDSVGEEAAGGAYLFPHRLTDDTTRIGAAFAGVPAMDEMLLQFALAGVQAMALGAADRTDMLAVSLSTTDAVGHRFGPDSREIHDQILRLDRALGAFIDSLYRVRDSSTIAFALTSDHGVASYPEIHARRHGLAVPRADLRPLLQATAAALEAHGVPASALTWDWGMVYPDRAAMRRGGLDPDSMVRAFGDSLRKVPGVARVDDPRAFAARDTRDRLVREALDAHDPRRLRRAARRIARAGRVLGCRNVGDAWHAARLRRARADHLLRPVVQAGAAGAARERRRHGPDPGAHPRRGAHRTARWPGARERHQAAVTRKRENVGLGNLWLAFDEARFKGRTLNLRESLPTVAEASRRTESWLREQQVAAAGEVLIVTGRGNNSEGGVSPVREAVIRLLHLLRRRGVVSAHAEHTPGSFVVDLAPLQALVDAPSRSRDTAPAPKPAAPQSLDALDRRDAHPAAQSRRADPRVAGRAGQGSVHAGRDAAAVRAARGRIAGGCSGCGAGKGVAGGDPAGAGSVRVSIGRRGGRESWRNEGLRPAKGLRPARGSVPRGARPRGAPSREGLRPATSLWTRIRLPALRADGRTRITGRVARYVLYRPTSQWTRIGSVKIGEDRTAR